MPTMNDERLWLSHECRKRGDAGPGMYPRPVCANPSYDAYDLPPGNWRPARPPIPATHSGHLESIFRNRFLFIFLVKFYGKQVQCAGSSGR